MQETVLILGARGRFGLAAARAFADAGWRVLAQMRVGCTVPTEARDDPRIHWLAVDVYDKAALAQAARAQASDGAVAVVVHALNPAYTNRAWIQQVLPMAEAALALCRDLQATLMMPGNVYNFGAAMPAVLREDTAQAAQTTKGRIRIGLEESLRRSGVRSVVIRAGDFFGAGHGTWFDQAIVKDIAKGVFTYPGPMDVVTAWAYLPDLARTFAAVAAKRAQLPRFEVLHFAGHCLSARQWMEALAPVARAQGWVGLQDGLRYQSLPWALIRVGALFMPTWAGLAEMRYLWYTPHQLANNRLQALLGAEPHTPLAEAAPATLHDLGLLQPAGLQAS